MKISFSIPGTPMGKERVVVDSRSKRKFTPKKTAAYEKLILQMWKLVAPRFTPHHGPVMIRFTAVFPVPTSWNKLATAAAKGAGMYYLGKPDCDNIQKIIMDALNPPPGDRKLGIPSDPFGHPWFDDGQVMGGGMKRYGSPVRLDVTLEFVDQPGGIMAPTEAKREERAIEAEQKRKNPIKGRVLNPHNERRQKSATVPHTPLERAIAAADARDAAVGRKT